MPDSPFVEVPAGLGPVLAGRGFEALTDIQQAVLEPGLEDRDLRISSQTGSGKTVALGLVVAADVVRAVNAGCAGVGPARPAVLLVAPTRELAVQLAGELRWLLAPLGAEVGSVTGGTSLEGDLRLLKRRPPVLVGTPGRLVDHLGRGSLVLDAVTVLALDEADEMLALGFAEEVSAILDATPADRRTHLVSATFPAAVRAVADRAQRDPVMVSGMRPGEVNADIDYQAMLVARGERLAALVNLLLLEPDQRTLVFVRTRVDAGELADRLAGLGFPAQALSGDLNQRERTASLNGFRAGTVPVLVATDVAARGLDVQDIGRVIHAALPVNADMLIHRSGRTGRAGRKGTSILFVPPGAGGRFDRMLREAGISAVRRPVPGPEEVLRAADERLLRELGPDPGREAPSGRFQHLAEALLADRDPVQLVATLLAAGGHGGPCQPFAITRPSPERPARRGPSPGRGAVDRGWARFQVSWGRQHGADPRRLLAVVCRRGGISSGDVGLIEVGERSSMVEVVDRAAPAFARSASRPDPRDPRIKIREWRSGR